MAVLHDTITHLPTTENLLHAPKPILHLLPLTPALSHTFTRGPHLQLTHVKYHCRSMPTGTAATPARPHTSKVTITLVTLTHHLLRLLLGAYVAVVQPRVQQAHQQPSASGTTSPAEVGAPPHQKQQAQNTPGTCCTVQEPAEGVDHLSLPADHDPALLLPPVELGRLGVVCWCHVTCCC